ARRLAVVAGRDRTAGSENPTMTWRVTPSLASGARRGADAKSIPPRYQFPLHWAVHQRALWWVIPPSIAAGSRRGRPLARYFHADLPMTCPGRFAGQGDPRGGR